jgi:signal transduction histidine kinase
VRGICSLKNSCDGRFLSISGVDRAKFSINSGRDMFLPMEAHKPILPAREMIRRIVQKVRNPLNALQLNVDSLEEEITEVHIENSLKRLKRIRNAIGELDSLLCEVLRLVDLSKPRITSVNINALVREVETFLRPESSKKEVTLKLNLADNLPETQADPTQIKQAILNVLLNAVQACPIQGSIVIATERKNDDIVIKVTDSGEGVPAGERDRIFEPFFSTKEGALGLGLSLALEIVRGHGGRISFTSEVGKGATFLIWLPKKVNQWAVEVESDAQ